MADDKSEEPAATKADEPELTQEQQQEQDALLAVNGDIKGELKPNRPLDDEVLPEEKEDGEPETTGEGDTNGEPGAVPPSEDSEDGDSEQSADGEAEQRPSRQK